MKDHIILIGFMGAGKTTTAKKLSYKLRRTLLDTDKMIERAEGCSISEIFEAKGEAYFRDKETDVLMSLAKEKVPHIISVGGGTPLREENRQILKNMGQVIYLKVSPDTVFQRLQGDTTRPLLQGENPLEKITQLLAKREPLYEQAAHRIIVVDGKDSIEIVNEILEVCQ